MKALGRASDVLFVLAFVLVAIAVLKAIKFLALVAFVVFVLSAYLTVVKRKRFPRSGKSKQSPRSGKGNGKKG